jgi:hypothetical protein
VLPERLLHPREVVGEAGERQVPVAVERIKAERVLIGIAAVDGLVVIQAIDAGARPLAGDNDRRILRRLIRDYA